MCYLLYMSVNTSQVNVTTANKVVIYSVNQIYVSFVTTVNNVCVCISTPS